MAERKKNKGVLPIYSLTPFTMLDYPDRTACIVWFAGCNFRCSYCHNPDLVKGKGTLSVESVFDFLNKRRGLLDAVVLSGGEATLYEDILDFAGKVKKLGFAVKLDTNGSRPAIVRRLLDEGFLDYIALDYKSPPPKCKDVTGVNHHQKFEETLSLLCAQEKVLFEVRTTVHTALMDEADIADIVKDLDKKGYRGTYFVQNFRETEKGTLKSLPKQPYILNTAILPEPEHFEIACRNF